MSSPSTSAPRRLGRLLFRTLGVGIGLGGVYVAIDGQRRAKAAMLAEGATRFTRAFIYGGIVLADYHFTLESVEKRDGGKGKSDEWFTLRAEVDRRAAKRLLHVCSKHGGIYTKFAQALSTGYGLSKEYTEVLSVLQDRAPAAPFPAVERVINEDFGCGIDTLFSSFEVEPVAAASLAQVHRARLRSTGEEVAVKVQYPHLRRQVESDLQAFRTLAAITQWISPDWGYLWLVPEFEASIRNELSFLQEARTGERVAAMFSNVSRVCIPRVIHEATSERVLCMEFIHGVRANDVAALQALGAPPVDVATEIIRFFSDQVYVHGLVHCDPHPGNLMVRRNPDKRGKSSWQLVVLDHGMYRRLSPQFRAAYCRLWEALVTRNHAAGRRASVELGMEPKSYDELSLLLTFRAPTSSSSLGQSLTKAEVEELRKKYAGRITAGDINRFLQRLPRDLLFVFRTTNMVRSLNQQLGGTTRQRMRIMGEAAIRGLVLTDAVTDFDHHARDYLAQQRALMNTGTVGNSTDNIKEAEMTKAVAPGTSDSTTSSTSANVTLASIISSMIATIRRWGTEPPTEPHTYINELSRGTLVSQPTESELLPHLRRSWWRRFRAEIRVWNLRLVLFEFDALLWLFSWVANPDEPHVSRRLERHGG